MPRNLTTLFIKPNTNFHEYVERPEVLELNGVGDLLIVDGDDNQSLVMKSFPPDTMYFKGDQYFNAPKAFNMGIKGSRKYEYMSFVTTSHFILCDYITKSIEIMKQHPNIEMVYADSDEKIKPSFRLQLPPSCFNDEIGVFSRSYFEKAGIFNESLYFGAMREMVYKCVHINAILHHIPEKLYITVK